jgi:TPR repeat protein
MDSKGIERYRHHLSWFGGLLLLFCLLHAGQAWGEDDLLKKAQQGDASAQARLGVMYAKGQDVAQNDAEAVKWYRLAADQGNMLAQNNLGVMYFNGRGVTQNHAEAMKWYRLAADQGHTLAQANVGMMYANGVGVEKNPGVAYLWFSIVQPRLKPTDPVYPDIADMRNDLQRVLTKKEIADAERQAEKWQKEFAKKK